MVADRTDRQECLHTMLMRLFSCHLSPQESRRAIEEFAAATRIDEAKVRELENKLPPIPKQFFDKWITRFARETVEAASPEKVELMCQGSTKGEMLILLEFFGFMEDHAVEMGRELRAVAASTGESADDLMLTLEALGSFAEERLHEGKTC